MSLSPCQTPCIRCFRWVKFGFCLSVMSASPVFALSSPTTSRTSEPVLLTTKGVGEQHLALLRVLRDRGSPGEESLYRRRAVDDERQVGKAIRGSCRLALLARVSDSRPPDWRETPVRPPVVDSSLPDSFDNRLSQGRAILLFSTGLPRIRHAVHDPPR